MPDALQSLRDAAELARVFATEPVAAAIGRIAGLISRSVRGGGKVMICGNGGSLCDAAHFAEELTGRFRADRPAIAAIALTDPGHLTCVANDYGFDAVFSRGVEALGRPGDVLVVLSTSGNSPNILNAVTAAKGRGMLVVTLLGRGGGKLAQQCGMADVELMAPGLTADRIQELHMLALHTIVELVEAELYPTSGGPSGSPSGAATGRGSVCG